jgi:hypothetical protein
MAGRVDMGCLVSLRGSSCLAVGNAVSISLKLSAHNWWLDGMRGHFRLKMDILLDNTCSRTLWKNKWASLPGHCPTRLPPTGLPGLCLPAGLLAHRPLPTHPPGLPATSSKRTSETFRRPNRILSCWSHAWQKTPKTKRRNKILKPWTLSL